MGADGGTKALQRKYLRSAKQHASSEKADKNEVNAIKWRTCAVSNTLLREPVVCCRLGGLYNKDAVIEKLLSRTLHPHFKHIRSLKDLTDLRLEKNPVFEDGAADSKQYMMSGGPAEFICPITRHEMSGAHSFCAIASCGCVLSTQALREVPSETCIVCGAPFDRERDVIVLNPDPEQRAAMKKRLKEERKAKKQEKDASKAAAAGAASGAAAAAPADGGEHGGARATLQDLDASVTRKRSRKLASKQAAEGRVARKGSYVISNAQERQTAAAAAQAAKEESTKRRRGRHGTAVSAAGTVRPSVAASASSAISKALRSVEESRAKSDVYKSLFNDGKRATGVKDANESNNLFIRVATPKFST